MSKMESIEPEVLGQTIHSSRARVFVYLHPDDEWPALDCFAGEEDLGRITVLRRAVLHFLRAHPEGLSDEEMVQARRFGRRIGGSVEAVYFVDPEQREAIRAMAKASGISMNALARLALRQHIPAHCWPDTPAPTDSSTDGGR